MATYNDMVLTALERLITAASGVYVQLATGATIELGGDLPDTTAGDLAAIRASLGGVLGVELSGDLPDTAAGDLAAISAALAGTLSAQLSGDLPDTAAGDLAAISAALAGTLSAQLSGDLPDTAAGDLAAISAALAGTLLASVEFTADARTGELTRTSVTCVDADTDYTQAIPDTALGVKMRAVDQDAAFAIDEATTAAVGGWLFADETEIRLLEAGTDRVLHLQSAVAATVVKVEFF